MLASRPHPLRHVRVFCVAGRHLSFKRAAEQLFLTPSAVSHQVRELEDELGVRLFERRTRSLELTPAGRSLLESVAPLLQAIDDSFAQVARRTRRRTLRLVLPPFFASELFVPRLASWCDAHPDVDLQIDTSDPRPAEHRPGADVSILLSDAAPPGFSVTRLFSLSLVAVSTPAHAERAARLGRNVFRQTPLIVHRSRPFAWREWAEEANLDVPEPKNVIELDTMFAVTRAAERGLGIALVPEALCAEWFRAGSLVRISSIVLPTNDAYYLTSRQHDADDPTIVSFREWATAEFGGTVEP